MAIDDDPTDLMVPPDVLNSMRWLRRWRRLVLKTAAAMKDPITIANVVQALTDIQLYLAEVNALGSMSAGEPPVQGERQ